MNDKFSFEKIDAARRLLNLEEKTTIMGIKTAYRNLAKKYHPDITQESKKVSEEMMRGLNDAFQILIEYTLNVPISFKKEDLSTQNLEEALFEQFKDDWLYFYLHVIFLIFDIFRIYRSINQAQSYSSNVYWKLNNYAPLHTNTGKFK